MPRPKISSDNTFQTSLRLPRELYTAIENMAERNERKPAEQIRYMLKRYMDFFTGENGIWNYSDSRDLITQIEKEAGLKLKD